MSFYKYYSTVNSICYTLKDRGHVIFKQVHEDINLKRVNIFSSTLVLQYFSSILRGIPTCNTCNQTRYILIHGFAP